jgi:N-acetylneuraminic acid mutarotase
MPAMPQNHSSGAAALINNELHYFGGVEDDRFTNTSRHIYLNLGNPGAGWQSGPDMPDGRDHMGHAILNGKVILIGGEFGHDRDHIATNLVDAYDPIAKTWTRLASLPINKSHMESSTFVYGGKIYCAGGQLGDQKGTDNVSMYDPAINKWTTIGKLPTVLEGPVVVRDGNRIIVTSGDPGTGPSNLTYFGYLS